MHLLANDIFRHLAPARIQLESGCPAVASPDPVGRWSPFQIRRVASADADGGKQVIPALMDRPDCDVPPPDPNEGHRVGIMTGSVPGSHRWMSTQWILDRES